MILCSCRVRNQKMTGGMKEALHKRCLYGKPPHMSTKQHLVMFEHRKGTLRMQLCARAYMNTASHLEKTLHRSLRRRALFQGRKPRGFGSHHRPILVVGTHGGLSRQGLPTKDLAISLSLVGPPKSSLVDQQSIEIVLLLYFFFIQNPM